MVCRVADHVGQRIFDELQNLTIKFCLRTNHLKTDWLIKFLRKIANNTRKLLPCVTDWLHAGLHDPFLQLTGYIGQTL